jgi:threonine dehydratase
LIAAGAGTLGLEILDALDRVDTIIVAVGGGGLLTGIAAAVLDAGIRIVAVEPEGASSLHASLKAGGPVDVVVNSIAADSLGARRVSQTAHEVTKSHNVTSVLVTDDAIVAARQNLWDERRVVVENAAAAAAAALSSHAYVPAAGEKVAVVLCGANTDPIDLVDRG